MRSKAFANGWFDFEYVYNLSGWVSGRLVDENSKFLKDKDYLRKYDYAIIEDMNTGDIIKVPYLKEEFSKYGAGFRQNINNKGKYKNYILVEFIFNENYLHK